MSALDEGTATFPTNVLECGVCYNIPSSTYMTLCQNGHVFCTKCRQRLAQCGICQSDFENRPMSNVLQKILTSLQVDCKFKDFGCNEKMNLEGRDSHEKNCKFRNVCKFAANGCSSQFHNLIEHEESCEFRIIRCYNFNCQRNNRLIALGPMANMFFDHYISSHHYVRRQEIESLTEFELSGLGSTFLSNGGKVHYIFVGNFGVDQLQQCVNVSYFELFVLMFLELNIGAVKENIVKRLGLGLGMGNGNGMSPPVPRDSSIILCHGPPTKKYG